MASKNIRVKFEPHGKTITVPAGINTREAVADAGIALDYPCGGQGSCGKCRVRILAHVSEPGSAEQLLLEPQELAAGMRLACQSALLDNTTIEVPETSLLAATYKILTGSGNAWGPAGEPSVRKRYVELPEPSREDDVADLERMKRALGPFEVEVRLVREISQRLREWGFRGTAVLADGLLIDFESGNTECERFVAAFDIGTTTLVGSLLDLHKGQERAATSRMNPQTSFGDDVLSRILHAGQSAEQLLQLQQSVLTAVNEMIAEMAAIAGVAVERIYEISFAGNTTMQHLLAGIDPTPLGQVPFVPVVGHGMHIAATELGLRIHPRGRAYVFPVIGGFVGGDTVAGVLATKLCELEGPTMLVDIGTNGEIVLSHNEQVLATSCAAGPAFEGARISHGMRAARGAIEEVAFDDGAVRVRVIGNDRPIGLCGSALIDLAAELLRSGALMSQGLLCRAEDLPTDTGPHLRERMAAHDGGAFLIASDIETQTGMPVLLSQKDIRELQLATGAIKTGITILLRRAGIKVGDLKRLLVAGAFGNYIRCNNAQRMGLLPGGLDPERIFFVGNTSLAGARMVAASLTARRQAEELARRVIHVDLALDPNFHAEYVEAMFFPE
ncbi:MAG: DUF4445 domain-containing protein [Candidatus Hydrogenedentes bacterium]|nr:DUF4445 domain-containing protein [Candidatus Hydrogenedentota bacterium]